MRPVYIMSPTILVMVNFAISMAICFATGLTDYFPLLLTLMTRPDYGLYFLVSHLALAGLYLITKGLAA